MPEDAFLYQFYLDEIALLAINGARHAMLSTGRLTRHVWYQSILQYSSVHTSHLNCENPSTKGIKVFEMHPQIRSRMLPSYHLDLVPAIYGFSFTVSKPSDVNATLIKHGNLSVQSSHEYHFDGRIVLDSAVIFQLKAAILVPNARL